MIVRQWSGLAKKEHVADYARHFGEEVLPALRKLAGFRGADVLRRDRKDGVEITVVTRWDSLEAIHRFAGEDVEVAVVAADAQPFFHTYDRTVSHHEVIIEEKGLTRR